jgi:hypothetical protein
VAALAAALRVRSNPTGPHDLAGVVDEANFASALAPYDIAGSGKRALLCVYMHRGTPVALSQNVPAARSVSLDISLSRHQIRSW